MYGITLYCNDTYGGSGGAVVVWYLWDSNTTPCYTILLCSALDYGNMYGIALYCNDTYGGGGVLFCLCSICGIVIPLQVIQLCSTLPWIVALCMEELYIVMTDMVVVWCGGVVFVG